MDGDCAFDASHAPFKPRFRGNHRSAVFAQMVLPTRVFSQRGFAYAYYLEARRRRIIAAPKFHPPLQFGPSRCPLLLILQGNSVSLIVPQSKYITPF